MRTYHSAFVCFLLSLLALTALPWHQASGQVRADRTAAAKASPTAAAEGEGDEADRANKWTVGLAGGLVDGGYIKFAADISTALDDGDNLRVMAILTKGSLQNVHDLLYLKGIDAGLVAADTFDQFKHDAKINNIENRIQYISQVHVATLQLLARPDIKSVKDLEGKKVATGPKGGSSVALAQKVLERYGVKAETIEAGYAGGVEKVKSGEYAAVFVAVTRGGPSILSAIPASAGLHLLTIGFDKFADEYYVPVVLEHDEYPNLIASGDKIETLGTPVVLAVYNWPQGTDRFRKVQRFIDYYFERFDKLKMPPYQPQWKEVNLAATVPGWKRYWYVEEVLKKYTAAVRQDTGGTTTPAPAGSSSKEEQLYKEFLEWKKKDQGAR
jgi:TRAP-type uncharacterized transport system substrate-binding protein